jgi:hypothetical protein
MLRRDHRNKATTQRTQSRQWKHQPPLATTGFGFQALGSDQREEHHRGNRRHSTFVCCFQLRETAQPVWFRIKRLWSDRMNFGESTLLLSLQGSQIFENEKSPINLLSILWWALFFEKKEKNNKINHFLSEQKPEIHTCGNDTKLFESIGLIFGDGQSQTDNCRSPLTFDSPPHSLSILFQFSTICFSKSFWLHSCSWFVYPRLICLWLTPVFENDISGESSHW